MQPATVETLTEEANLQPDIALAIAKAFDIAIDGAKLVTLPVFDSKLTELRTELRIEIVSVKSELRTEMGTVKSDLRVEIASVKADLVRWVFIAMGCNVILSGIATLVLRAIEHTLTLRVP